MLMYPFFTHNVPVPLQELVFLNGANTKQIQIEIINDDIPEPDETFEVILSNPKNGLVLGTPSRGKSGTRC